MNRLRLVTVLAGWLISGTVFGLDSDINEGDLRFLDSVPGAPPYHHSVQLILRPDSLKTGWLVNRQCHKRLDVVPALQVVFSPGRMRNLRILQAEDIGQARVENSTVQLTNVGAQALLCLESEIRRLDYDSGLQQYVLTSGPHMRRFLDGYFPMQVTFELEYPVDRLRLIDIQPQELRGRASTPPGRVHLDALFEGRLDILLRFLPAPR